jgi:hypothetical protein
MAPGLEIITARMLKELPKKRLVNSVCILNAILPLEYTLAYINKDCTYNKDNQTLENSNRRFILTTNHLTTDNFKKSRKAYTKKIQ